MLCVSSNGQVDWDPAQIIYRALSRRRDAITQQCEGITEIFKVLIFPLIALSQRVIASRLCERALKEKIEPSHFCVTRAV